MHAIAEQPLRCLGYSLPKINALNKQLEVAKVTDSQSMEDENL